MSGSLKMSVPEIRAEMGLSQPERAGLAGIRRRTVAIPLLGAAEVLGRQDAFVPRPWFCAAAAEAGWG